MKLSSSPTCTSVYCMQVVQSQLYGGAYCLVKHFLRERLDIDVTYIDSADVQQFKAAIQPNTKVCKLQYIKTNNSIDMTAKPEMHTWIGSIHGLS